MSKFTKKLQITKYYSAYIFASFHINKFSGNNICSVVQNYYVSKITKYYASIILRNYYVSKITKYYASIILRNYYGYEIIMPIVLRLHNLTAGLVNLRNITITYNYVILRLIKFTDA